MHSKLKSSLNLPSETKEIADNRLSSLSTPQLEEKKSHCTKGGNQEIQNEPILSLKAVQPKVVDELGDIGSNCLEKVIIIL